jgi:hypothetical protein
MSDKKNKKMSQQQDAEWYERKHTFATNQKKPRQDVGAFFIFLIKAYIFCILPWL